MTVGEPRVRVGVAEWRILQGAGTLTTSGLGSCVAVAVYDLDDAVGGLLHAMLPEAPDDVVTPAKYVDTGLRELLAELDARGVKSVATRAKVAGGSAMLDISIGDAVGERNVDAASNALEDADIPLLATDTGGNAGRSVSFRPESGDVTIERVGEEERLL